MRLKVLTIVGTRPEVIKLSRVINELKKHTDHLLAHTGQNYDYELNKIFFDDLEIDKPDYFLECQAPGPAETIANVIQKTDHLFEQVKPDALLIYGDTNSCLCTIPAKRRKIPIFHMEAGNRCFDQRVPEELNRKIVDHLSDINIVHSEHARRNLLNEGLPTDRTFKSGSPMREIFYHYGPRIEASDVHSRLGLNKGDYFVVSMHREENVDSEKNFISLLETLNLVAKTFGKRVIVSTHPRTRKRLDGLKMEFSPLIEFMKPLGFFDYNKLQKDSICVLSDSGGLTEDSSLLGFPGVMIRQAHERPEGMDVAAVVMSGLKPESVIDSVRVAISTFKEAPPMSIRDYDQDSVSVYMMRVIRSYTDFVNRVVWHKT